MTFHTFSTYLQKIENTTSRNEITVLLAQLFNGLDEGELEPASWLLLGRIVPPYEGVEFQFAEKMMIRALSRTFDAEANKITASYKAKGDLAEVAESLALQETKHAKLSVTEVFSQLEALAHAIGEGSQERKIELVIALLSKLDPLSVRFAVRIILTRLRLGFSDMTILDALSWAKMGDKSKRKDLEDAYQMKCDIGKLTKAWMNEGEKGIATFDIELGIPLQPALCQRLKTADEMIDKMGKIFMESKYDGTRVQIHIKNHKNISDDEWEIRTFTRSLEESSEQFPELIESKDVFGDHSLILDCEAIGFDPKTGKLLPFQETIQRKRKHDVDLFSQQIPLKFFVFDVLYKDGKSLIKLPLFERKQILHSLFESISQKDHPFIESASVVTQDADELRVFHKKQLDAGLEGAVIKKYDSVYQPGRKGWSWVKFKEEETAEGKLSDTIDAVVMGYWYGKGKRNQFGVGAFLIGILGQDEKILTLSKVGTGLSDEQWKELKSRCETLVTATQPKQYIVNKLLIPDVWVDPKIVVEVAGDELTKSPTHSAEVALRFPRLVRFRDDKKPEDITTTEELQTIR